MYRLAYLIGVGISIDSILLVLHWLWEESSVSLLLQLGHQLVLATVAHNQGASDNLFDEADLRSTKEKGQKLAANKKRLNHGETAHTPCSPAYPTHCSAFRANGTSC